MTSPHNTIDTQALADWIGGQLASIRNNTLREISSLLVHDLSTPLHVVKFVQQRLDSAPTPEARREYIARLASSVESIISTLDAGRAYLACGELREVTECSLGDAWDFVGKLLRARYFHRRVERLRLEIDPSVSRVTLETPICDAIFFLHQIVLRDLTPLLSSDVDTITFRLGGARPAEREGFLRFDVMTPGSDLDDDALARLRQPPTRADIESGLLRHAELRLFLWQIAQVGGSIHVARGTGESTVWRVEMPGIIAPVSP